MEKDFLTKVLSKIKEKDWELYNGDQLVTDESKIPLVLLDMRPVFNATTTKPVIILSISSAPVSFDSIEVTNSYVYLNDEYGKVVGLVGHNEFLTALNTLNDPIEKPLVANIGFVREKPTAVIPQKAAIAPESASRPPILDVEKRTVTSLAGGWFRCNQWPYRRIRAGQVNAYKRGAHQAVH